MPSGFEFLLFSDHDLNMHVELGTFEQGLDEDGLAATKARNRAVLAERLERIWAACEPFIDAGVSSGAEVRMVEVALRTIDRLIDVLEVDRPDRPGSVSEVVLVGSQVRRAEVLSVLEGRAGQFNGDG